MSIAAFAQFALATLAFIAGASSAKGWAVEPTLARAVLALALYTGGNILMLHLVRMVGMAVAFSLSAVLQLVAVNLVAVLWYGESLNLAQGIGVVLAVAAVVLVTFGPSWAP